MPNEAVKEFLTRHVFTPLSGYPFAELMRLMVAHRFRISPRYWPRGLFMTLSSVANSRARSRENRLYDSAIHDARIQPPLFILGHWRSGTTHLHNLLTIDKQFCYPNFFQVTHPYTFLTTEEKASQSRALQALAPATRLIDNMQASLSAPMEDEVALAMMTGMSPVLGFVFPRNHAHFDKYLTFRDTSASQVSGWQNAFLNYLKKLTVRYERPIVLKSPPHTCRIKMLLEVLPEARFIFIHRDPLVVFQSYKRSGRIMRDMLQLQRPPAEDEDGRIIEQYTRFHDAYLEQRDLIPRGQLYELSYQSLEEDPLGQLQTVYETLGLEGFAEVEAEFRAYLDSLSDYRKSDLPELEPAVRQRIATQWARFFSEWGYTLP